MKTILAALVTALVATTAAVAAPAVGDQATFQGVWDGQAVYQHMAYTEFNGAMNQFKKITTTQIGSGAPATSEEWVNFNDAASDEAIQYILNNCGSYNGINEYVNLPSGQYFTCRMPLDQGGYVWVGQVPFAVVRIYSPVQGKMLDAWITGFRRGI